MIKIDKLVTITITEEDVQTLSNICQCADIHLKERAGGSNYRRGDRTMGEWDGKQLHAMGKFIDKVWD